MNLRLWFPQSFCESDFGRMFIRVRKTVWLGLAIAMLSVGVGSGCLTRPALHRDQFLISAVALPRSAQPVVDDVVSLAGVVVAPSFSGRQFVYRMTDAAYEVDSYAGFLVPPDRMFGTAARESWRRAGIFRDVLEPESRQLAGRTIEMSVLELYGDFRQPTEPAAVLTIRFVLTERKASGTAQPVVREFTRKIRLSERTAAAVAQGWQKGFGEILSDWNKEIAGSR